MPKFIKIIGNLSFCLKHNEISGNADAHLFWFLKDNIQRYQIFFNMFQTKTQQFPKMLLNFGIFQRNFGYFWKFILSRYDFVWHIQILTQNQDYNLLEDGLWGCRRCLSEQNKCFFWLKLHNRFHFRLQPRLFSNYI